jgi:hypothetical protein
VRAIASLLWPVFAFVLLLVYRRDVRGLLPRLLRVKLFGQELELDRSLDALRESATDLVRAEPELPGVGGAFNTLPAPQQQDDLEERLLNEAVRSPRTALMLLSAELEQAAREVLASSGWLPTRGLPLRAAIEELDARSGLAAAPLSAVQQFLDVRNRIVHGHRSASDDDVLRALDSGLQILRAIRAVPHERHKVRITGVPLFKDQACTEPWEMGLGVMLESESAGRVRVEHRIFPTVLSHFRPGMRVTWEWDASHRWGETWYRNPETDQVEYAWTGAMAFAGRDIDGL